MLRNYFLIAVRNLWRNRLITLINIAGMAIGIAMFLAFFNWIRFDLSYDRFHEDHENLYILNVRINMNTGEYTSERTGGVFGSLLPEQFPQVLGSCRVSSPFEFELGVPAGDSLGELNMRYINEPLVLMVDSTFLKFYSFRLKIGNPDQVFSEPDHMVITESLAESLFGSGDPLGKTVRLGEGDYFRVAGVAEDPPEASTFQFRALLGFHVLERMGYPVDGYGGTIYYSGFRLAEGTDVKRLNKQINEYVQERMEEGLESYFFLDHFTRIHLHGETRGVIAVVVNLIMALVILCIAVINFINLTTAYASERVKEISIRKTVGAGKRQLILQFMGETYLLLLVAFYLGLFLSEHLTPWLSRTFEVGVDTLEHGAVYWVQLVVIFVVTGLLAGIYPSSKIAGLDPLSFLYGKKRGNTGERSQIRKVLIVVQYAFSIIFIIVSIFMIRQYDYLREADLGFNRDDVVYVRTRGRVWQEYNSIKEELEKIHFVEGVTTGSNVPVFLNLGEIEWGERDGDHNRIAVILETDEDFLSTFEIGLAKGTYFRSGQDSLNRELVVVNQALVDLLGWEDPVGRSFYLRGRDFTVAGITENIDFFPFNLGVFEDRALIYQFSPVQQYVFIRVVPGIAGDEIARIGEVFRKYNPEYEFDYQFVGEYSYNAIDNAEGIRLLFILFSGFAILIATMGLIGLSIFYSNRRVKEVGIRKAMGARSENIMRKFMYDFLKLVGLANIIGLPLAYLLMNRMLQLFSYSVELKVTVFLSVMFFSLLLSMITIFFRALRVSRSNPVESLRYE